MLDIGWSEMAIVALIALLVLGPKELPKAMRSVAKWVRKAKAITRDFQSSIDEMVREAELEETRETLSKARKFNPNKAISDTIDPTGEVSDDARQLERDLKSEDSASASRKTSSDADDGGTNEGSLPSSAPQASESADADEEKRGTVVKHPVRMPPGNSVTPPKEEGTGDTSDHKSEAGDKSARSAKQTA